MDPLSWAATGAAMQALRTAQAAVAAADERTDGRIIIEIDLRMCRLPLSALASCELRVFAIDQRGRSA
jgi:hypothetical protein